MNKPGRPRFHIGNVVRIRKDAGQSGGRVGIITGGTPDYDDETGEFLGWIYDVTVPGYGGTTQQNDDTLLMATASQRAAFENRHVFKVGDRARIKRSAPGGISKGMIGKVARVVSDEEGTYDSLDDEVNDGPVLTVEMSFQGHDETAWFSSAELTWVPPNAIEAIGDLLKQDGPVDLVLVTP